MQENPKSLENEAWKQECLPGTSSKIPETPQHIPSPDSPGQPDGSVRTPPEINY